VAAIAAGVDGRARLELTSGRQTSADVLIFTDRTALFGPVQNRSPKYRGVMVCRGHSTACPDWIRGYVIYLLPDAEFTLVPEVAADGRAGLEWALYLRVHDDEFIKQFRAPPTDTVRDIVAGMADRWLPRAASTIVQDSVVHTVTPVLDADAPGVALHTVGNAVAIVVGDAIAVPFSCTGQHVSNGLLQVARLSAVLALSGDERRQQLLLWERETLRVVTGQLALGRRLIDRRTKADLKACLQNALDG
jgi:hypothetical protein